MVIKQHFSKDLDDMMQFSKEGIFSTVILKRKSYSHTLMCLAAGTDIDEHTSTKEGVVLVLKGEGKFKLYDDEIEMKNGIFIFMPKDAPHSLKAETDLAILLILNEAGGESGMK